MIGASTRIENAILTDSEIDWIDNVLTKDGKRTAFDSQRSRIQKKLSRDKERSLEEIAGCRTMLHLIYEQSADSLPLTESTIRGLHAELMRHDSRPGLQKGAYKTQLNSVVEKNHATGEERMVFSTADPGLVTSEAMADLVQWYNLARPEVPWTIPLACEFVFRFLAIHPFQDGNGRLGRGLFLLCLLQANQESIAYIAKFLAIDRQIERYKEEYYLVLNRCSDGKFAKDPSTYQLHHFLSFMLKVLESTLEDINFYLDKFHAYQDLSKSALTIFMCFKERPELRLRINDLCHETKLPRRTINNVLLKLRDRGFIQRFGKGAATRYQIIF